MHLASAPRHSRAILALDNLPRVTSKSRGVPVGDPGSRAAPRRVVIAEDEALIRLDLKEMLEEDGFAVVAEADGSDDSDGTAK